MKKFIRILALLIVIPFVAYAAGRVLEPSGDTTSMPIAGENPSGNAQNFSVDANGNLNINISSTSTITPSNGSISIASNGATDRYNGSDVAVTACTFQSSTANTDTVYFGGSTVTNSSGANQGISFSPGESISNVTLSNLNTVYFSSDSTSQTVFYFCN